MKRILLFYIIYIATGIHFTILGQNNSIKSLSTENGLSNNIISSIVQDNQGFIWIGTEQGLNKYDGYKVTIYPHIPDNKKSIAGNRINELLLSSSGKLWISTNYNGLSLYDLSNDNFKNFKNSSDDITSLSQDLINDITEDANKNIWIGTYSGLNSIDTTLSLERHFSNFQLNMSDDIINCLKKNNIPENIVAFLNKNVKKNYSSIREFKNEFIKEFGTNIYKKYEKTLFCWGLLDMSVKSQIDEKIMSIAPDNNGNLWLGFFENGLAYYDTKNSSYIYFKSNPNISNGSLFANDICSIFLTKKYLWIGGTSGWIDRYNLYTKEFKHFKFEKGNTVFKIKSWNDSQVIFMTEQGLMIYDQTTETILSQQQSLNEIFRKENINQNSDFFEGRIITDLYKDNHDNIWIGTKRGVFCIEKCKNFKILSNNSNDSQSIYWGDVNAIENVDGEIYIGFLNSDIDILNKDSKLIQRFYYFKNNPYNIGDGSVQAIAKTPKGDIIIGTYVGGAQIFDKKSKKFITIPLDKSDVNHLGNHDVKAITTDSESKIWIALNGGGLSCYDPETKKLLRFKADYANWKTSLHENWLTSVFADSKDNIWISSNSGGMSVYNQHTNKFISYKAAAGENTISNNSVNVFYESIDGKVWIGTNAGLDLYNRNDSSFTYYPINYGAFKLPVYSILEDDYRNLWLGTNKGLVRFSIDSANIKVFTTRDGIHGNEFIINSSTKTPDGTMYFGGKNGITYFNPKDITNNQYAPPVVLTGLKLFYSDVLLTDTTQTILMKNINVADQIVLEFKQNIITFDYAALNYINSEKNEYKYTLQGFDNKWYHVGNKREATYTSLAPGEYIFRVVACNNDGIWNNEGASIKVIVLPPWWQTWWFRGIVVLFLLGVIFAFFKYKQFQYRQQNKILEQKVQIRTEELTVANQEIISQNEQISKQRDALEKQNKMITQSITSGQRIQSALLPSEALLQSYFDDYFILYYPRDIVSGDFYWSHWVNEYFFIIASDCTGHGIPGAFMSMLGNAMLNEIIIKSKIHDPAQILFELNKNIQETFKKTQDGSNSVDEGMDITVAAVNTYTNKLHIASALQPFYITINGKIECVSGDMFSIGEIFSRIQNPEFTTKIYDIEPGMCLYIGSDGIVDQFSSETKKKFTSKRLIQVLEENKHLSMQSQVWAINEAFENWKSTEPQLDDIMLIGLRFS